MVEFPDVQSIKIEKGFKLTRVGIEGVKKGVVVRRPQKDVYLIPTISVSVDLPSSLKGSHLSRNIEAIIEVVESTIKNPAPSLEDMAVSISKELLNRHDYATYSEVNLKSDYFLERITPDGKRSQENYVLVAKARNCLNEGVLRKMIGVQVVGMSACPCAEEGVRAIIKEKLSEKGADKEVIDFLKEIPVATHNQRNTTTLAVDTDVSVSVEADDLIQIVENSFSTPTFEFLKREGEAMVVYSAHMKLRFVEDVVREILKQVVKEYSDLPDNTIIYVKSLSEESIHKHNAFAERVTTLKELKS